jgi:hypothetical protein
LGFRHFNLDAWEGSDASSRARYLDWVDGWKWNYAQLTNLIRELKKQRVKEYYNTKFLPHLRVHKLVLKFIKQFIDPRAVQYDTRTVEELYDANLERIRVALEELRRVAQQMMNARYNMKMASYGIKMKSRTNQLVG